MALWGGRFTASSSSTFKAVNDSLPFDQVFAHEDIFASIVWSKGLVRAGVLTADEQSKLEASLEQLSNGLNDGSIDINASSEEDIHSFVESYLVSQLGDLGKKLHTGRSRNDQVATDFRLWICHRLNELKQDVLSLCDALVESAQQNIDVIIPGYTHLQRAQPVYYAHWCLAYVEMLKRDIRRIEQCILNTSDSPLGCGALAGTTFSVDREQLCQDLGFNNPCLNSLDAVSDRDFVLEFLFVAATGMMHLSRVSEDLIFFNSGESGFITLGDEVTSGSSLMPQKKNPDALELMRGKCGRVFGHLQGLLVTMKGLPLAYNKDMQEDKEGAIDAFKQYQICLRIGAEVINSIELNSERSQQAAQQGYANATELADYLVEKDVPFRTAHDIAGQAVRLAMSQSSALENVKIADLQTLSDKIQSDVYQWLDLKAVLEKRNQLGGTGHKRVTEALYSAQQWIQTNTPDID